MSYSLTWEKNGVVKRFWGNLTDAEFLAAHHAITEDFRLDSSIHYVITDFTGLKTVDVSDEALQIYCVERNGAATYLPNIRGALVADTPLALWFCLRITAPAYSTPYEMQIFTTIDEATAWLTGVAPA